MTACALERVCHLIWNTVPVYLDATGPIGFVPPAEHEANYYQQVAVACVTYCALSRSRAIPGRFISGSCLARECRWLMLQGR